MKRIWITIFLCLSFGFVLAADDPILNPPQVRQFAKYNWSGATITISVPRVDSQGQEIDQEAMELSVADLGPVAQQKAIDICRAIARKLGKIQ